MVKIMQKNFFYRPTYPFFLGPLQETKFVFFRPYESVKLWAVICLNGGFYISQCTKNTPLPKTRGVIDMIHIDISINLLKQYSLLSLVNTHINVSKYQKNENGHLEKKLRAEYCWCCLSQTF